MKRVYKLPELRRHDSYEFKVDAVNKQVLCLILREEFSCGGPYEDSEFKKKVIARGIARAKGDDIFNEEDGKNLAAAKAYSNYLELDRKNLLEDLKYSLKGLAIAKKNMQDFIGKKAKAKRVIAALKSRM